MKASRKSCGHEWGQFIIHAYTHTQTGVTIKTVQLFPSDSRIKRLSAPRDPWEPNEKNKVPTRAVIVSSVCWSFCCASCVVVLAVAVLSTSLCCVWCLPVGPSRKSSQTLGGFWCPSLGFGRWRPALAFDCFVSFVALFETVKEWGENYKPSSLTFIKFVLNVVLCSTECGFHLIFIVALRISIVAALHGPRRPMFPQCCQVCSLWCWKIFHHH